LLFAHDDWISFDENDRPVSLNYSRKLVDRYRYLADRMVFAVRGETPRQVRWFKDAGIHCLPDTKHGLNPLKSLSVRRTVDDLVKEHDIVVARLPSLIGSWALRSAWRQNKPVLVEMVGCPWDALWNHSLKGKLVAPWFWLKNRRLLRRSRHTVYVTENFLQRRYPTRGCSVACSNVETVPVSGSELQARIQKLSELSHRRPIVLGTIANLDVPYKGHDLVLRALAAMPGSAPHYVYRMIGPGDPERLDSMACTLGVSDRVEFTGSVPKQSIASALDDIDVYIQPSRQEGLPRALLEAMSRGCIAIGCRTGGIPELLGPPWLVPRNDWRSISELLKDLFEFDLKAVAIDNIEISRDYEFEALESRRRDFYDQFLIDARL
jgi:glycosyltransferase involved in cell wall biosynthesis